MQWRFLPFVLVAAALPLVVGMVVTGELSFRTETALQERATGASGALQSRLDAEMVKKRELLLRLDALGTATHALREAAARGEAPPPEAALRLREVVRQVFRGEPPELLAVATPHGVQVVITNGEPVKVDVGALPLVGAALDGQTTDAFGDFDDNFYRFAAAPVGMAEAAIVVGDRYLDAKAIRLRDAARADVTVVRGNEVLLSSLPREWRHQVLPAAAQGSNAFRSGDLEPQFPWLGPLERHLPLFAPKEPYLSVAREIGGVSAVLTLSAERELAWLVRVQVLSISLCLGLLLVGLAWMRFIYGPVSRQVRSIEAHLARLKAERGARLGTRGFSGIFRRLARQVDETMVTLERQLAEARAAVPVPERAETPPPVDPAAPRPRVRPMGELPLAAAPTDDVDSHDEGTPAFPFADDPAVQAVRAAREATPPSTVEVAPAAAQVVVAQTAGSSALAINPLEIIEPEPPKDLTPPPVAPPIALEESRLEQSPPPQPPSEEKSGPIPLPPNFPDRPTDPPATRTSGIAHEIPPELLPDNAELEAALAGVTAEPEEDAETRHFREVHARFVEVRRECGEPTEGLSFERFVTRLEKSRDQLKEKYGCSGVRFNVYVKEGKAAVKASPVR